MNIFSPPRHGKLTGIYNESHTWKEFFQIVAFIGIPFALIFALISLI